VLLQTPSVTLVEDAEGIVRLVRRGDISIEDARELERVMAPLVERSPLRLLADPREGGQAPPEVRRVYYDIARRTRDARVAIVGARPYHHVVANLVLRATTNLRIEYFDDEAEARRWLLAPRKTA